MLHVQRGYLVGSSLSSAVARIRAGLRRAKDEGKTLGRPRLASELESRIRAALSERGRTKGVRKIAEEFGVSPSTVQAISRPLDDTAVAA